MPGPRIYAAGQSIATTGGHADPRNGLGAELEHVLGPPGPTDGVINSVEDARQAVRQRDKDGSDLIKITATGGVLSYARSGDAPQFTTEEVRAVIETIMATASLLMRTARKACGAPSRAASRRSSTELTWTRKFSRS